MRYDSSALYAKYRCQLIQLVVRFTDAVKRSITEPEETQRRALFENTIAAGFGLLGKNSHALAGDHPWL